MSKQINTAHIIGLGAIGGTYASIMTKHNKASLKVIVDARRKALLAEKGLTVNGTRHDFDYTCPEEADKAAELILIAVKAHQLDEAIAAIKPFAGRDTVIMSLLNGISSEETIARSLDTGKILHAFCVGIDALKEGQSIRYSTAGKIVFGDKDHNKAAELEAVRSFFDKTGLPYQIPNDIMREMWWKFLMNIGFNQTSAILRAPYGVYKNVKEIRELMFDAASEVLPLAKKEGINLTESDIQGYFDIIDKFLPDGKTSMLQDVEAGRKTEVESFALAVMELGKKHHIPTPVNAVLYKMIRVIEQNYPKS